MGKVSCVMPFDQDDSFQESSYYYSLFGVIPNALYDFEVEYHLDVIDNLINNYKDKEEFKVISIQHLSKTGDAIETSRILITLPNKLLLTTTINNEKKHCHLSLYHSGDKNSVYEYLDIVRPHRKVKQNKPTFKVISDEGGYLSTQNFEVRDVDVNIEMHYNDDFVAVDSRINSFLDEDRSGLIILHGKQGTGKTTYIRNIIKTTDKDVIYISSDMAHSISTPNFIPFILRNTNSVIILEDCEELLSSRMSGQGINSGLVNILNMSDGLLGDALKMKFICTFNAPLKDIDKALLRKGRLVARYEFGDLTPEKANKIITAQSLDVPLQTASISLSELYNYETPSFVMTRKTVGF